ncbi:response regulator [Sandaracinus amylolyticus]|nr:response regulator [Sandaracinus amylolyticus]
MTSSPMTIVVIEDHADSLEMICEVLELRGLVAHGFSSGAAAWAAIAQSAPDVVMTDLRMGTMSGIELAKLVRNEPSLDGVALVALSGDVPELQRHQSDGLFDMLLAKPVDLVELPQRLEALRGRRAARVVDR